jgi:hypothetical protein
VLLHLKSWTDEKRRRFIFGDWTPPIKYLPLHDLRMLALLASKLPMAREKGLFSDVHDELNKSVVAEVLAKLRHGSYAHGDGFRRLREAIADMQGCGIPRRVEPGTDGR